MFIATIIISLIASLLALIVIVASVIAGDYEYYEHIEQDKEVITYYSTECEELEEWVYNHLQQEECFYNRIPFVCGDE